jgi:hypothetical protein
MRSDDEEARTLFLPLTCAATQAAVTAERTFSTSSGRVSGANRRLPPLMTAGRLRG